MINKTAHENASKVSGDKWNVVTDVLEISTTESPEFIEITNQVKNIIDNSGIVEGQVLIYSTHTTCSIVINENEQYLLADMCVFLEKIAPKDIYYRHNDFDVRTEGIRPNESANGHSHCQQLVLGTSETIPIVNGQMLLGEFQNIMVVEKDEPKIRKIVIQVTGFSE